MSGLVSVQISISVQRQFGLFVGEVPYDVSEEIIQLCVIGLKFRGFRQGRIEQRIRQFEQVAMPLIDDWGPTFVGLLPYEAVAWPAAIFSLRVNAPGRIEPDAIAAALFRRI